jgi:hypothetical protein
MLTLLGTAMISSALTAILVVLILSRGGGDDGKAKYYITLDQQPVTAGRRF